MSRVTTRVEELRDGSLWNITLDSPPANILDAMMVDELTDVFARAASVSALKAICIAGAGKHFSFGASVDEHRPDQVADMLGSFHKLFRVMAEAAVPTLAVVRGQCLGGGLELATFANRVFASPDAVLGQPEIRLGVIAPVASALLSERIGRGAAEDLCMTGRVLIGKEALNSGLVDELDDDPAAAALRYFDKHLAGHSASSLRFSIRAVRLGFYQRFFADLDGLETMYLNELQKTHDAKEGIQAFLDKRQPEWRDR